MYQIIIYLLFRRYIKRWSAPVKESGLIAVLDGERVRMNLRGNIRLRYCKGIKTPMLAGFVKPWLLLPDPLYNTEDLPLIFRHELTHYKRRDLWYKLALTITKSIFWFNPAVHLMAVQANKDIETICDTLTVSGMDITQRKRYSEIILNMAADPRVCRSRFTTCFVGGKNMLEQRFSNILGAAKKNGVAVFTFLGILILTAGILVGFRFTPKPQEIPSGIEDDTILSDTITLFAPKVTTDNVSKTESKYNNGLTIDGNDIKINGIPLKEYYSDNNPDVYNNLDELKKLLYDEAKVTEREFESVSSLNISSGNDHVSVSHGGDKPLIRYYEWIENQYSLEINNSELILKENNRPYYKTGNMYTDGWIVDCLKSMGKQTYTIIEIVIPESMKLDDITINVGSGSITVAGCVLDSEVTLNVGSGQVSLENSSFDDNASINSGSGTIAAKNCIFNEWVSLDTGSGTINAVSCTFSGKASVGAGSGLLNVENCNLGQNISLSVGSGIGYLKLANSAKEYDISFIASSGRLIYNDNAIEDNTLHNKNAASKIKLSVSSGSFKVTDMN